MLDWLGFIGNFFLELILMVRHLVTMALDAFVLIDLSFHQAPVFLAPVITCVLAVAIIMWVVNLL